jgi:hypothetical protein
MAEDNTTDDYKVGKKVAVDELLKMDTEDESLRYAFTLRVEHMLCDRGIFKTVCNLLFIHVISVSLTIIPENTKKLFLEMQQKKFMHVSAKKTFFPRITNLTLNSQG